MDIDCTKIFLKKRMQLKYNNQQIDKSRQFCGFSLSSYSKKSFCIQTLLLHLMSSNHRNRSRSRQKASKVRQRSQSPNQSSKPSHKSYKQPKGKQTITNEHQYQQTKILSIQDLPNTLSSKLQQKMTDTSISMGTSVPDEVQSKGNTHYIKYPSIEVASQVYKHLMGSVIIEGKQYKLKYWPVQKSDVSVMYDWYCDKCQYKNFAKRGKCHRCDNQKNPNCRLNYGSQFFSVSSSKRQQIDDSVNCSLMIRGPIITEIEEEILLNIFQGFAPIKDIRMIRNKMTGGNKDFAFIEFFTPEEAAFALKKGNAPDFKIGGQKATVMYSKTKQDDEFFARPYDKQRRGMGPRRQTKVSEETPNYYIRQRQMQIEEEKKRPLITLQQLKEKHEQEMKKNLPQQKEISEQQKERRRAEMLAKQWEKELKTQVSSIYICVLCKRKFKNEEEMSTHSKLSELHKYKMAHYQEQSLAL